MRLVFSLKIEGKKAAKHGNEALDSKSSMSNGPDPIYSQVQKSNANGQNNNRSLIITNGTTNADSWV